MQNNKPLFDMNRIARLRAMPTGKMPSKALLIGSLLLSTAVQATTLRIDNEGEPGSLDPQQSNNLWDSRIQRELFDRLVDYSAEGELVPGLAERWEVSDDGLTWTFHLRDAQWSDGQPITADDAVYSLRRLLSPAMANQNAKSLLPHRQCPGDQYRQAGPRAAGC
ncbi:ABC transporter substrate-binding protein [Kushneria phosphatilytica]|uniref:ABC transporter substrate-binding protein n=1 Tax=Kushneria phosphatilytica TaxID=657387 RepID=UPI000B08EA0A|nr:ABC transporter substrate-binding protein [Kushneria phosphatilytica]